jgi:hypothetical protein
MTEQKKNIFVAKLARNAAATVMVGACVLPTGRTASANPQPAQEFMVPSNTIYPSADFQVASTAGSMVLRMPPQAPLAWDRKLEKEFRALALLEAKNEISSNAARRLEQLSTWRDELESPITTEETLLQIKRDRLISRMENLLQEYVEFQEAADHARRSS